jgi:RNA polymerase primary sigma factor
MQQDLPVSPTTLKTDSHIPANTRRALKIRGSRLAQILSTIAQPEDLSEVEGFEPLVICEGFRPPRYSPEKLGRIHRIYCDRDAKILAAERKTIDTSPHGDFPVWWDNPQPFYLGAVSFFPHPLSIFGSSSPVNATVRVWSRGERAGLAELVALWLEGKSRAGQHQKSNTTPLMEPWEHDQFAKYNQRLVGWVASRYRGRGIAWWELVAAGNIGLVKAIHKFDPKMGKKFSTYAVPLIRGEITALFKATKAQRHSDRRIRATVGGVPLVFDRASEKLERENEQLSQIALKDLDKQNEPEGLLLTDHIDLREAVAQDLETEGGLNMNAVQARAEGIGTVHGCAEFSADTYGEEASEDRASGSGWGIESVADTYQPFDDSWEDKKAMLENTLSSLQDERQFHILTMHYGLRGQKKQTLEQIGKVFGISPQRVAAIEAAALKQIKQFLNRSGE